VRLVVDAVPVRAGSAAIVIGNLLAGWVSLAPEDEIVVLVDGRPEFPLPESVAVEQIADRSGSALERVRAQSIGVRGGCRRLRADALLCAVTASAFAGAPCPRGAIVYDLRHEQRPEQFSASRRLSRRLLYGWSFLRADALFCISERTRGDLLERRPGLRDKAHTMLLGADHAAAWRPSGEHRGGYVLAFGHFANKNVDGVLAAWRSYAPRCPDLTLRICGLGASARARAEEQVRAGGIADRVELLPWLDDADFESLFAGAAAVLFPSDFEGFGLPALEALLLGVPVVVSADPALAEVTAGHAVVAPDDRPETLATALDRALGSSPEQIAAGVQHARGFTWERTASVVRGVLAGLAGQPQIPVSSR
jgi:glycosyltransferase involved in cell wall biosynthesis